MLFNPSAIKAICFDVIGTCVDWRGTIVGELERLGREKGVEGDWHKFAHEWAAFYAEGPFKGEIGLALKGMDLLSQSGLKIAMEAKEVSLFCLLWTRLFPWPDARPGLARLRMNYRVAALTNLGREPLIQLSHHLGHPWDQRLSAEAVGVKKPDPRVYRYATEVLGLPPSQILMVAAHRFDLRAAQSCGFRTAFVERHDEHDERPGDAFDLVVSDFHELADRLARVEDLPVGGATC